MKSPEVLRLLTSIATFGWFILLVIWVIGAMNSKPTRQRQPWRVILLRLVLPAVILSIAFSHFHISPLGQQQVPPSPAAMWAGFFLDISGIVFACSARFSLGSNWSGHITIKEDHSLIRRGPYKLVRHPIYSGLLAGGLGAALLHGYTHCYFAVAFAILAVWIKLRMEEQFLVQEFGEEYLLYRREVRALIPFLL